MCTEVPEEVPDQLAAERKATRHQKWPYRIGNRQVLHGTEGESRSILHAPALSLVAPPNGAELLGQADAQRGLIGHMKHL